MERYLLGIDVGTSACKVIAVDGNGRVAAKALASYPLVSPRPGWAEQDPEHWWQATQSALTEVLAALPDRRAVAGIGLSGQMHGLAALGRSRQRAAPAILWCDQRAAPHCDEITARAGGLDGLLAMVQNRMLPGFTAGKLLWMREHERTLRAHEAHAEPEGLSAPASDGRTYHRCIRCIRYRPLRCKAPRLVASAALAARPAREPRAEGRGVDRTRGRLAASLRKRGACPPIHPSSAAAAIR